MRTYVVVIWPIFFSARFRLILVKTTCLRRSQVPHLRVGTGVAPIVIFFGSIGLFVWSCLALRTFDFFGIEPIIANIKATEPLVIPFIVRGPYKWVRHPIYLAMLLIIWSCPSVSIDRFLFNIIWTVWIVVATMLEERDLEDEFGEGYLDYKLKVPMLFPRRLRPAV